MPETDGWDEDAAAHPAIRRIHRIFLFFGFFFLIAALIAGFFLIPVKIVKNYPSGGKRVYYVNRLFYYIRGDHLHQRRWTDTIYDSNGDVLLRFDIDKIKRTADIDISPDNYNAASLLYYNENIQISKNTVLLLADALSDQPSLFSYYLCQPFDDIADRLAYSQSNEIEQELLKTLNHPNASVRRWAIIAISRFPKQTKYNDVFIPALIDRLDDQEAYVIVNAMMALADYRKPDLLPHIIRGYNIISNQHEDYLMTYELNIEILTNVGSVEDAIAEISRINTESELHRNERYDFALLALNPETREQAYQEMLSIPSSPKNWEYHNIEFMIDTLLRIDPKRTTEVLVNSSVPIVLPRSTPGIDYSPDTIPFFMKCLTKGDPMVQRESARILLRMRALKSAPAVLINYLSNPNEYYRYSAVVNLGRIGDPSVIPQLDSIAKNDPDKYIRRAATDALIRLRNNQ